MVQMTPVHFALWWLLTLGGRINEKVLRPLLAWLVRNGRPRAALGLLSPILNWYTGQVGPPPPQVFGIGPLVSRAGLCPWESRNSTVVVSCDLGVCAPLISHPALVRRFVVFSPGQHLRPVASTHDRDLPVKSEWRE